MAKQSVIELDKPIRVLVVDDEEAIVRLFEKVLEPEGFRVSGAMSLDEARRACTRQVYDLIVVDKNLPDGSGLELWRRLFAEMRGSGGQVVAVMVKEFHVP